MGLLKLYGLGATIVLNHLPSFHILGKRGLRVAPVRMAPLSVAERSRDLTGLKAQDV